MNEHLGASLMADEAADGVNYDWWQEFASQAKLPQSQFDVHAVDHRLRHDARQREQSARQACLWSLPIAIAVAMYLLAWLFVTGGILDRFARGRPTGAYGFFAASGVFFFRFLRLAVVAVIVVLRSSSSTCTSGCLRSGTSARHAICRSSARRSTGAC